MHTFAPTIFLALFSILLCLPFGTAQETEHQEHGTPPESEAHDEQHGEQAEQEDHVEAKGHGGRSHPKNDVAIFLGLTDEHGQALEPTLGFDYKRRIAHRWSFGGLFDYAGGDLRNAFFAASITWWPVGKFGLTAAPGIEIHRGRGPTVSCGCGGSQNSEGPEEDLFDEDERYFVLRLGVGWPFPIGENYAIEPNVNIDLVDGEKVWVYGFNFIYAW